jgi:hypothetical protein
MRTVSFGGNKVQVGELCGRKLETIGLTHGQDFRWFQLRSC